jgi:hypothetical protein
MGNNKNKTPLFPHVKVSLVGKEGNAFSILGAVKKEMKKNQVPQEDIDNFFNEAMSGDYDNVLRTVMKYVNVN